MYKRMSQSARPSGRLQATSWGWASLRSHRANPLRVDALSAGVSFPGCGKSNTDTGCRSCNRICAARGRQRTQPPLPPWCFFFWALALPPLTPLPPAPHLPSTLSLLSPPFARRRRGLAVCEVFFFRIKSSPLHYTLSPLSHALQRCCSAFPPLSLSAYRVFASGSCNVISTGENATRRARVHRNDLRRASFHRARSDASNDRRATSLLCFRSAFPASRLPPLSQRARGGGGRSLPAPARETSGTALARSLLRRTLASVRSPLLDRCETFRGLCTRRHELPLPRDAAGQGAGPGARPAGRERPDPARPRDSDAERGATARPLRVAPRSSARGGDLAARSPTRGSTGGASWAGCAVASRVLASRGARAVVSIVGPTWNADSADGAPSASAALFPAAYLRTVRVRRTPRLFSRRRLRAFEHRVVVFPRHRPRASDFRRFFFLCAV